jgi:hypothetical protein
MRGLRRWIVPMVAASIACARAPSSSPSPPQPAATTIASANDSEETPTHIELAVDNHNWADVIVSVEHDGARQRLGTIKAATRQSLQIPGMWVGPSHVLRLIARRIGSLAEFRSEGFTVQRDQVVDWTLESDLERSSLGLR